MHQNINTNKESQVLLFSPTDKKGIPVITFGFDAAGKLAVKIHDHAFDDPEALSGVIFNLTQRPENVDKKIAQAMQNATIKHPEKFTEIADAMNRIRLMISMDSMEKPTMTGFDAFVG